MTQPPARHLAARQRGGVTLAISLIIALLLSLLAASAHHALLSEQRMSANHHHAAIAFDAAEAGIDWMLARLNGGTPGDTHCRQSTSFRDQHAGAPDASGRWRPPGTVAACLLTAGAWACHCSAGPAGATALPPVAAPHADHALQPRFSVTLRASERPDVLQAVSSGCVSSTVNAACADAAGGGAAARITIDIGHLPALAHAPVAALTVRDSLAPSAHWTLHNRTPGGTGITLHAGGEAPLRHLTLASVPGSPVAASVAAADATLKDLSPAGFFASLFRLDKPTWQTLPTVRRIACSLPCDTALRQAYAGGVRQFWLDGGLTLSQPGTLGSTQHPVVLVAHGPVRLTAAATVHGVIFASVAEWTDTGGTTVHGAVVAEGNLGGSGGSAVHHDPEVLAALKASTGTFARVPGSWRDF